NLSPPPDKKIFPGELNTDWIKPGRAVWRYLDGGENTFDGIKEFSRLAGQLGFEYNVVEGIWQRWAETQIRELVDYSNQQNVKLWFWKHSRTLRTPQAREEFFSLLNAWASWARRLISSITKRKKLSTCIRRCCASRLNTKSWLSSMEPTSLPANHAPGPTR